MTEKLSSRYNKIAGNDQQEVHAIRGELFSGAPATIMSHQLLDLDNRARYAMQIIERWGMVAAQEDGEDSAGRAKLRLSTPDEIVSRACECADKAFVEFAARGWSYALPTYAEVVDAVKEKENSND